MAENNKPHENFDPVLMSIMRKMVVTDIAQSIIGVQPLTPPASTILKWRAVTPTIAIYDISDSETIILSIDTQYDFVWVEEKARTIANELGHDIEISIQENINRIQIFTTPDVIITLKILFT